MLASPPKEIVMGIFVYLRNTRGNMNFSPTFARTVLRAKIDWKFFNVCPVQADTRPMYNDVCSGLVHAGVFSWQPLDVTSCMVNAFAAQKKSAVCRRRCNYKQIGPVFYTNPFRNRQCWGKTPEVMRLPSRQRWWMEAWVRHATPPPT